MKGPVIAFFLYLAMLGAWLANEALTLYPRFDHLPDSVDSQAAILERRLFRFEDKPVDYPVWRHRVIMPLAIEGLARVTPLSRSQAYLVLRWVTACLALAAFASLLRHWLHASYWFIALGIGLFALTLGPTFLHIYDIPSDFLDAAAMALLTQFALQHRPLAFLAVLLPALLNREGALFAVPLWAALHAYPVRNREQVRSLALPALAGVLGVALVQGVRWLNALPANASVATTLQPLVPWRTHMAQVSDSIAYPHPGNPLYYLIGLSLLFGMLLRQNWPVLITGERRLAAVALLVALFSALFGNIIELRIQMAALVWFSFLSVTILHRRLHPATSSAPVPAA